MSIKKLKLIKQFQNYYNIPGCPSKVCKVCLKFLEDIFYFTKRYETVEKFYIELLKNKNKNVNLYDLKAKYKITDDQPEVTAKKRKLSQSIQLLPVEIPPSQSFEEIGDYSISFVEDPPTPFKIPKTTKNTSPQPLPTKSAEKSQPKILNPTILPKIENKLRLELLLCDLCTHTTSTKLSLEKHMEVHLRNEMLFECKICLKKFAKRPILINHLLTHKLSSDRKTFQCKECGKHLSSQSAVNSHMKWHHQDREFICHVCSKEFATVSFQIIFNN